MAALRDWTGLTFDGDEVVTLQCGPEIHDIFGQLNVDPGDAWGTSPSTMDVHLERACWVTIGDRSGTDLFDPAVQWVERTPDDTTALGTYSCP